MEVGGPARILPVLPTRTVEIFPNCAIIAFWPFSPGRGVRLGGQRSAYDREEVTRSQTIVQRDILNAPLGYLRGAGHCGSKCVRLRVRRSDARLHRPRHTTWSETGGLTLAPLRNPTAVRPSARKVWALAALSAPAARSSRSRPRGADHSYGVHLHCHGRVASAQRHRTTSAPR